MGWGRGQQELPLSVLADMPLCVSSPRHQKTNLIVLWVPPACGLGEGRGQAPHMGKLRPPHEEGHPQYCRKDGPGFSGPPTLLLRVTFLPWGSGDGSVHRLGGRNGGRGLWDWLSPLRRAVGGGVPAPCVLDWGGGRCADTGCQLAFWLGYWKKKNPSLRKDNLVILEVWISGSSSARSSPPPRPLPLGVQGARPREGAKELWSSWVSGVLTALVGQMPIS